MEFTEYLNERVAPSTSKRYQREVRLFSSYQSSKNQSIQSTTYTDIMNYIGQLRKEKKNVVCSLYGIKKYCEYLVTIGVRKDNPSRSIKLKDKTSREIQLQDFFTTQELEQLLDRKERYSLLKNRNKLIVSLLIYQGLTNGEIKSLELKDIDLEQGAIYVKQGRRTNSRSLKLKAKQVYWLMIYIEKDRVNLLKEETEILIINQKGKAETGEGISYLVETMRSMFPERKLNAKTIRQSVITNLLKRGKDLRLVQAFAGHKYPSTTEKYKQNQVEELKLEILKYHPLK